MKDSRSTLSVTGLPSEHYVIDAQRLSLGLELDAVIKIRDRCAELVINRSNIRGVTNQPPYPHVAGPFSGDFFC